MRTEPLPPFPNIAQYVFCPVIPPGTSAAGLSHFAMSSFLEQVSYERARAEAAIARLKVAVEALVLARNLTADDCPNMAALTLDKALIAIGDIPE